MKKYIYFVAVAMFVFSACKKSGNEVQPTIEGFTTGQIDSIAAHYGFKPNTDSIPPKGKSISVKEFIQMMETRKSIDSTLHAGRKFVDSLEVQMAKGEYFEDAAYVSSMILAPADTHPLYNFTFRFQSLKDKAFPSLYNITWILGKPGESASTSVLGASYEYDRADNPALSTTWAYNNHGGTIGGTTEGFVVRNFGVETETLTIAGTQIYSKAYRVEFLVCCGDMRIGTINARVSLTQLN